MAQGRVRDKPFRDALRKAVLSAGDDRDRLNAVAHALVRKAKGGDVAAIKELADRLDGRVPQAIEAPGSEGVLIVRWLGDSEPLDNEAGPPLIESSAVPSD